jgi:hypothetical protein
MTAVADLSTSVPEGWVAGMCGPTPKGRAAVEQARQNLTAVGA